MFKSFIKHINNSKGKIKLALAKFHIWAFILSAILFVIAGISAYSVYMEGKTAQNNGQELLEQFEQEVQKIETPKTPELVQADTVLSNASKIKEPTPIVSSIPEITEKPQVKSKPIAKIYVEKLGLNLSVLSEWSYDLLEISVCKFSGPEPNETGNFIIIGHNYLSGAHFGKLSLLEKGDLIDLTDLSGRKKSYEVYEILTINPDEVDKLATNEECTMTLITCTSYGTVRLVVKCEQVID